MTPVLTMYENGCIRDCKGCLVAFFDASDNRLYVCREEVWFSGAPTGEDIMDTVHNMLRAQGVDL